MSFFSQIAEAIRNAFAQKQKDEEFEASFTNPPAKTQTPIDPDNPWMT